MRTYGKESTFGMYARFRQLWRTAAERRRHTAKGRERSADGRAADASASTCLYHQGYLWCTNGFGAQSFTCVGCGIQGQHQTTNAAMCANSLVKLHPSMGGLQGMCCNCAKLEGLLIFDAGGCAHCKTRQSGPTQASNVATFGLSCGPAFGSFGAGASRGTTAAASGASTALEGRQIVKVGKGLGAAAASDVAAKGEPDWVRQGLAADANTTGRGNKKVSSVDIYSVCIVCTCSCVSACPLCGSISSHLPQAKPCLIQWQCVPG
jgi:hypothetical protein